MSETQRGTQRDRSLCAISGGAAGMVVMTLLFGLLQVQTRSQFDFFGAMARFAGMPGELGVGFVLFAMATIVIWPVLFVAVEPSLPGSNPHTNGMIGGMIFWFVFITFGLKITEPTAVVLAGGLTLLTFLGYGLTFGEVYARLLQKRVPD